MQLWKTCRAVNNEIRLAMLREIARSPNRELNVLQAGDFVGLKKAAASQYLKQLAEAGFLTVERTGKFVVCSGKAQGGTAASRIAKALEAAFPAKARSGWQAALLTAINAFARCCFCIAASLLVFTSPMISSLASQCFYIPSSSCARSSKTRTSGTSDLSRK